LPTNLADNARSLGAHVIECASYDDVVGALATAKDSNCTTVIYVQNDRLHGVPGCDSWWDVPVAEVSTMGSVQAARADWERARSRERFFF
jgi:3D-(3,5/4)-trihydroxycyclohexane-1,2-dione acylhydrolase (decyclizing)